MDFDEPITEWIEGMRRGDEASVQKIWECYFQKLVQVADGRLPNRIKRVSDEEDVALSAFHSLYEGVVQGRFPQINDRHNLWSLLVVIAARKASHAVRDGSAQKRGGGRVVGESVFGVTPDSQSGIQQILGQEPTPEFAATVAEESERLLAKLPDDSFRHLVSLKLEGYSNGEIATKLNWGKRTIERRLALIRKIWTQSEA